LSLGILEENKKWRLYMNELSISELKTTIRVDEDNGVILAYDYEDGITDESSEGILNIASSSLFNLIKEKLQINPLDYAVELSNEDSYEYDDNPLLD
jgi:hypothetical protein